MLFREIETGQPMVRWTDGFQLFDEEWQRPLEWFAGWTAEQLGAEGLYRPEDVAAADPIPDGKVADGASYVSRVNGSVKWVQPVKNAPQPTLAERRPTAIAALKQRRWEVEVGGVTVTIGGDPVLVSTARGDDRLNLHIMMTLIGAGQRQDGATFNFADGVPREVSNTDMLVAIGAALQHVQQAFDREAAVTALIEGAGTHAAMDDAMAAIDTGWPS